MEETKNFEERYDALTEEQRKALTLNAINQNQQLMLRVQQMQDQVMFKKLDYLFKVVEIGTFDTEFEDKCRKEIYEIMVGETTEESVEEAPKSEEQE